ncbi:site-specific DNA-methyltransferase (adenine-specific) [Paenibacillus anaericanus]|uniref:DNA-methyltransferase n=1 Tax=Paenibacillus anaericanus TaxID=170367 RepID=UPI00277D6E7C|nr:site-specific DNA-methyltransferase [Paenibacillus anaericanus]MDQ0087617.1 site-specific DNA-methyltransferase (adenine-specific) [Paenibacillus anaericanus]
MFKNRLYKTLNIASNEDLKLFSKKSKIPTKKLKYYNEQGLLPYHEDLQSILQTTGFTEFELKIKLGILDDSILDLLNAHSKEISILMNNNLPQIESNSHHTFAFETQFGQMYQGDCVSLMNTMKNGSVDLIFADPPFNLDKEYESGMNDKVSEEQYLRWTEQWVLKCVDLLKEGGSLFIWNLPKWNTYIANILNKRLTFKHWIATDIKYRLPIKNKLYPSHYSLLYYTKGEKANTFNEQRLPLEICRKCGGDIRDYGGYKDKLNPLGINLTDVWYDIPPVRHSKFKTRESNELSMKLLERVISLSSNVGDLVFDPFGGSGTTYAVSEILKRKWIGIELGSVDLIKNRLDDLGYQQSYIEEIQGNKNVLFTEQMRKIRIKKGHWLPETLKNKDASN